MNKIITQQDLRDARKAGVWQLWKDAQFRITRHRDTDDLKPPSVVIKAGTFVYVEKVYRKGRAALLCYIDKTGKVWWSWTHATVYEPKIENLSRQ